MRFLSLLSVFTIGCLVAARSPRHVGLDLPEFKPRSIPKAAPFSQKPRLRKRATYLNNVTADFAVDGTAIPDVDFDLGESYAGLLPISDAANETSELYFWFFPSSNPAAENEILIWLNGGPGCSSLEGLLQEHGPFLWQYGTFKPVSNPWAWRNLTNVVYVEQPVGTGFSQGTPTATSEEDVASQFLGFFKNFVDTFSMQGYTVYVTGESYAGYYVPYIADAMFNKNDTTYYNVSSIMIYDPSLSYNSIQRDIVAVPFVDFWYPLMPFNDTFMTYLHAQAETCGYNSYLDTYLTYPPPGALPTPPSSSGRSGCSLWRDIYNAALLVNPCWDVYQVATTCPLLWDVLGFPGSFDYLPDGASIYFNRADVKAAINAPADVDWQECTDTSVFLNDDDTSLPSALSVLPHVIERTHRTIIGHGLLDMILLANGSLLAIQNMTWNGAQGFSAPPTADFFVPYHDDVSEATLAASGNMGKFHTERGLTYVDITLSGHMVPQYAPSAAYRQLEFLLGRIPSLNSTVPFSTS